MKKIKCGDANQNGNVAINYKGSCGKELKIEEAYRCVGCGGWFHLDCIYEHFKLEEGHDNCRYYLNKIAKHTTSKKIKKLCQLGLDNQKPEPECGIIPKPSCDPREHYSFKMI